MRKILLAAIAGVVGGCATEALTTCNPGGLAVEEQSVPTEWRGDAERFLALSPPDSVMHVVVFLDPRAKQAFVDWAASTGGGFGYQPTIVHPDSVRDGPEAREPDGVPETVPGVMIRYEFSAMSAFSVYMPVRTLEGLLALRGISGVDFGIGSGDLPLC